MQVANGSVYPTPWHKPGALVTSGRLTLAKWQACKLLQLKFELAESRFRNYAVRKYKCKPQQVKFQNKRALRRIKAAILFYTDTENPPLLGQTDDWQIEISGTLPMTHVEIVSTLVHEAMHNWCLVRGKYMSCQSEHRCMHTCGDPNE